MLEAVRASAWTFAAVICACHPSATVERTMPVANLQSYRTVALRVHSTAFAAQGMAMYLEGAVLQHLHQQCGFEQISQGQTPADVVLDLNVTQTGRGGNGWVQNQNKATLDTLLVLTDGQTNELLGTARIHGESSGMIINNAPPENEAIEVVAKTVADLLAKSGCSGPRVARAEPPPAPPGPGSGAGSAVTPPGPGSGSGSAAPVVDDAKRAEGDKLNADGGEKLRRADLAGALASFQQANQVAPDPRYVFNVCLTYEAMEQWDNAVGACKQARAMNPNAQLAAKIDHRLDLLAHRQ